MADIKKNCKTCGGAFWGSLQKKYCGYACGFAVVAENARQLKKRRGRYYRRWKEGVQRYIEGK